MWAAGLAPALRSGLGTVRSRRPCGTSSLSCPGGGRAASGFSRARGSAGLTRAAGQCAGLPVSSALGRLEKEEEPVHNSCRKRRGHLNMEIFYNENEGKPEDEVDTEDEGKSDEEEKPEVEGKPAHEGKLQEEGQPDDAGQQDKLGKSEDEGKARSEGKPEPQAKPGSEPRAAEKRPAEDYVPRKAKRKTDRETDDSPKDYQDDSQDRHVGSEEMRECGAVSRAQEELRKKQKMGGFHWMQRDVQDPFAQRANGVSGE
ncbi:LOW QUALITY PROTEIN: uncharacterized protein RBU33_015326 [Hipposideros larvatus]